MTTISGALPTSPYNTQPSAGAGTAASDTGTRVRLWQTAVTLSGDAAVIATLGASGAAGGTYDAAGLLNAFVQAQTDPAASGTPPSADQAIVNGLTATPGATPLYSVQGGLQPTLTNVNANIATILKTDAGFAATAISDATDQGIVATISTFA